MKIISEELFCSLSLCRTEPGEEPSDLFQRFLYPFIVMVFKRHGPFFDLGIIQPESRRCSSLIRCQYRQCKECLLLICKKERQPKTIRADLLFLLVMANILEKLIEIGNL